MKIENDWGSWRRSHGSAYMIQTAKNYNLTIFTQLGCRLLFGP